MVFFHGNIEFIVAVTVLKSTVVATLLLWGFIFKLFFTATLGCLGHLLLLASEILISLLID
jgi:hypothetical protein